MLEAAVARLETITFRLEETEARLASIVPPVTSSFTARLTAPAATASTLPLPPAAGAPAVAPVGRAGALGDYRQLLSTQLYKVVDVAEGVGGQVLAATRILAEGFQREAAVVEAIGACQKPNAGELQQLVQPVGEQMVAAGDLAAGPRSPYQSHFKLVSEAMQSLSWVAYTGPNCGIHLPGQHVDDALSASDFYANKVNQVLMEWRAKDPAHVAWVQALKELLQGLKAFCARHYPAGPQWNAAGVLPSQFKPGTAAGGAAAAAAPVAAAKQSGPPPPPLPPPPLGSLIECKAAGRAAVVPAGGGGNPMAALFADINKGSSVTSGLRKITDDMKTKNHAERSGAVPADPAAATAAAAKPKAAAVAPRLECEQGRKWVVENQVGNREIVIKDTQPKQTVYVYNCIGSTIQVWGKVNAITLDKCSRTGLLFNSVVATVELVNCSSVEVQCTGVVPTVSVDKCDGCQLYLPRGSLEGTDIVTAKSSEVNVIVPGATDGADPMESAIPEQFVTCYRGGRWVTEPVAHSGA